jgi:hypothetical protein
MKIFGKEITEGIVLTVLGVIFFSVVGGTGYYYRHQIAWMRFMFDSGNVFELIDRFEQAKDPGERFKAAVKISYHSAQNIEAQVNQITKSTQLEEPIPDLPTEPTGREGAVIRKAIDYVEWGYSLVDYYVGKIPVQKMSQLMKGARARLIEIGFKNDFSDQELAQAYPSFGKVKACTNEDFGRIVESAGAWGTLRLGREVFLANLRFSAALGAEAGEAVLQETIGMAESAEHAQVLKAILELHEMRPVLDDLWVSRKLWRESNKWEEVSKMVMPARRAAAHCFQSKNFRAFMDFQEAAQTNWRAKQIAEGVVKYIREHGKMPEQMKQIVGPEDGVFRDAWGSEFKIDRTETEIVISSVGKDHKAGTEDDFVHRREFIFGGE